MQCIPPADIDGSATWMLLVHLNPCFPGFPPRVSLPLARPTSRPAFSQRPSLQELPSSCSFLASPLSLLQGTSHTGALFTLIFPGRCSFPSTIIITFPSLQNWDQTSSNEAQGLGLTLCTQTSCHNNKHIEEQFLPRWTGQNTQQGLGFPSLTSLLLIKEHLQV